MAVTKRNAKLDSRSARARLAARREPYWAQVAPGFHIGYRKGATGGSWIAKHRNPTTGTRTYEALGAADDVLDADGSSALSFAQAQERARTWLAAQVKADPDVSVGPYTVKDAAADYMTWFRAHRKGEREARSIIDTFILPTLGRVELSALTARRIREWHAAIAESPARFRRSKTGEAKTRPAITDDAKRQRRATANRKFGALRAILNFAYRESERVASDDAWRRVKPFRLADVPRVRHVPDEECRRLVNAAGRDFRKLIQGALLTGCRYGELVALRCGDFDAKSGTLHVRDAKAGQGRSVVLTDEGRMFFAALAAGRASDAHAFVRESGAPWKAGDQARPMRAACAAARIAPRVSFHILRHAAASRAVMAGVPLQVVAANLGHTDARTTTKYYAHLTPDHVADTIRAKTPAFGIVEPSNVTSIGG